MLFIYFKDKFVFLLYFKFIILLEDISFYSYSQIGVEIKFMYVCMLLWGLTSPPRHRLPSVYMKRLSMLTELKLF